MDHSYEEIRKTAIDILAGREKLGREKFSSRSQTFATLSKDVKEALRKRDRLPPDAMHRENLSKNDEALLQEVFWDLFRQNVITLGTRGNADHAYPYFRLSSFGKKILENEDVYFFHDLSSYEKQIRETIPDIDDLTIFYLKEAMQAFMVGCRLSSSVMLGVALEHSLNLLYEDIKQNDGHRELFSKVFQEQFLLRKFKHFRNGLDRMKKDLPKEITEDLETNLDAIVALVRNYRNESGHPSGNVLSREQCYVNLQLFIPCCEKIYDLRKFFENEVG
ncbi:MAG: hypothetical protein GX216_11385 [Methanomicrobiales archaeon]|nr:hypothetical protein [Methanomicrobiales archaeon]